MDTERDENQNLKSDVDSNRNDYHIANTTEQNHNLIDDKDLDDENQEDTDYTDDQNNSNTGYTEKLLEKEFVQDQINNEGDLESNSSIDEDLVVKNGNILVDEKINENEDRNKEQ